MKGILYILFIFICICTFSGNALAFTFVPRPDEFNSWTYQCQAIYASTHAGSKTDYVFKIPANDRGRFRKQAEKQGGAWHYCESLIHLRRAKMEVVPEERAKDLDLAYKAARYTYVRMPKSDPWYAEMAVTLGNIVFLQEKYEEAEYFYNDAINLFPKYAPAYMAKSLIYRKLGDITKAIETLKEYLSVDRNGNSEIYYFMGLFSLEINDIENAKVYAEKAYKLGYPLPGLRDKLEEFEN